MTGFLSPTLLMAWLVLVWWVCGKLSFFLQSLLRASVWSENEDDMHEDGQKVLEIKMAGLR